MTGRMGRQWHVRGGAAVAALVLAVLYALGRVAFSDRIIDAGDIESLQIIPVLGTFVMLLASLYGIYVLYLGLPHTMKVPPEKNVVYLLAIIATGFVLGLIFWILMLVVFGVLGLGMAMLT